MGVLKGLKSIKSHNDEVDRQRAEREGRVSAKWLTIADGESVKVRFLQELDEDSPAFSEKNGIGFIAVEHTSPADYRRKAVCTADDGDGCYACDQSRTVTDRELRGKWRQKLRLYINVLVDDGKNEPYVAVLSQGTSGKSITPTLIEFATDNDSITNRYWKIKRTGSGLSDTSYTLIPNDPGKDLPSVEDYEVFDLEKSVVRTVPLAEQPAFYAGGKTEREAAPAVNPSDVW